MAEPSVRTSRFAIAGGLLAILVGGGAGFFVGRNTAPQPAPAPPSPVEALPPAPPEPRRALDRADIITLAQQAADAFASGNEMPENVARASGRRFSLAIPFGCSGPSDAAGGRPMRWRYDAEEQALRASIAPMTWQGADWGLDGQVDTMTAKGFWIARPWSSSDSCPPRTGTPAPSGAEAITLPGQTLAIAQFFSADADRSGWQVDRPFEVVKRIAANRIDDRQGMRLRVTGRIDGDRRGIPVRCVQPGGMEQRPICVVTVQMEEIRLELPASGEVLGTWPVDQSR